MNTRDLMNFGFRELEIACSILIALKRNNGTRYMGDNVVIEFNPNSGNVFLVDEDHNVAMMSGDTLCDWHNLSYEGHKGFIEDLIQEYQRGDITNDEDVNQLEAIAEEYGLEIDS